jgi:hypothetical protein
MTIDATGYFAGAPKSFGEYFERVTPESNKPTLIMCSDFPLVVNRDGNIYYAYTRHGSANIIKRTPGGKESVFASNKIFEFISGITAGADGSLYITESTANANTIEDHNGWNSIDHCDLCWKDGKDLPLEQCLPIVVV